MYKKNCLISDPDLYSHAVKSSASVNFQNFFDLRELFSVPCKRHFYSYIICFIFCNVLVIKSIFAFPFMRMYEFMSLLKHFVMDGDCCCTNLNGFRFCHNQSVLLQSCPIITFSTAVRVVHNSNHRKYVSMSMHIH